MSDTKQPRVPPHVRNAIESLRGRVIDIEANANAAAESLDRVPYLPRLPRHPRPDVKPEWTEAQRRDLGRMQSMVYATADVAQALLAEYNEILVALGVEGDPDDEERAKPDAGGASEGDGDEPIDGPGDAKHRAGVADNLRGTRPRDGDSDRPTDTLAEGAVAGSAFSEHPGPRRSLGRVVVDFQPLPPGENADGVVTLVIEDIATRPCHRTPAEHEAALLAGAKTTDGDASPAAKECPTDAAPSCS